VATMAYPRSLDASGRMQSFSGILASASAARTQPKFMPRISRSIATMAVCCSREGVGGGGDGEQGSLC
jgi:hypothetical protein